MSHPDRLAVRQHLMRLIDDALPPQERCTPIGNGDELASVGITSLVLLQVVSRFIEDFHVDPSVLMNELGELRNVGQLLSLGERLAGH